MRRIRGTALNGLCVGVRMTSVLETFRPYDSTVLDLESFSSRGAPVRSGKERWEHYQQGFPSLCDRGPDARFVLRCERLSAHGHLHGPNQRSIARASAADKDNAAMGP